jgi:hypothetical protein
MAALREDAVKDFLCHFFALGAPRPRLPFGTANNLALARLSQHPHVAVLLTLVHIVVGPEQQTVNAGVVSNVHAILHAQTGRAPRHRAHVRLTTDPLPESVVNRGAWHALFRIPAGEIRVFITAIITTAQLLNLAL